jgi:hypothetical protein
VLIENNLQKLKLPCNSREYFLDYKCGGRCFVRRNEGMMRLCAGAMIPAETNNIY